MPLLGGRNGLMGTEREATALPLSLSRSLSALWFLWESWEMEEGTIASEERRGRVRERGRALALHSPIRPPSIITTVPIALRERIR